MDTPFFRKKSNQMWLTVVGALLAVIIVLLAKGGTDQNSEFGLVIDQIYGDLLFSTTGEVWEKAEKQMVLNAGFRLKTGARSKAVLSTHDGGRIRLDENTEIQIDRLNGRGTWLTQLSGRTFHRIKTEKRNAYQIRALAHTIKPAGGAIQLSVNPQASRINAKVLDKKILLVALLGKKKASINVEKGKEITIEPSTEKPTAIDIPASYFQDAWFRWNRDEERAMGFELTAASETPEGSAPSASPPGQSSSTGGGSVSYGSCKPYLTVKKDRQLGGIRLNWSTCSGDDFQFYKVVRSSSNTSPSYPNDGVVASSSNKNFANFTDKNVLAARTYSYRVCAVYRLNKIYCGNAASITY